MLKTQGTGLIEVLVSMLIITSAGLGTLYLLSVSQREQASLMFRSEARSLATEIYNRRQINTAEEAESLYATTGSTAKTNVKCNEASCTPAELAKHDVGIWTKKVVNSLPDSQYDVQVSGRQMSVSLGWKVLGAQSAQNTLCPSLTLADNEVCITYVFTIEV